MPAGPRRRVLPADEATVGDDEASLVRSLLIEVAETPEFVLDEERHDIRQADLFFLGVGEARNTLALHDRLALIFLPGAARRAHGRPR